MKTIVLQGDHTTKLYARLSKFMEEAKKRGWEIANDRLDRTPSLFGTERLVVYRKYSLISKNDIKSIAKIPGTLVIFHEGYIPQAFIKTLPKETKIEEFKLPKSIWGFLDNIAVRSFHEVLKSEPVEFVFSLVCKRFRDLYWVKISPDTMSMPAWQLNKLKYQAGRYSLIKLEKILNSLSELDIKVKTSSTDLISELDLILISQVELAH